MMRFSKGISCPPHFWLVYTFPIESREHLLVSWGDLFWQRNYYWVDCFSSCKFQVVVATVALIVHHSVAIIPMPYTELKQLCCCYFSRSLMIMCVRNTELLLSLEASEMSAVITQSCKVHQKKKIMANRV